MYLIHKERGMVGTADLPEWVNFDEHPPRTFKIKLESEGWFHIIPTSTLYWIPVTKEVYDIVRDV